MESTDVNDSDVNNEESTGPGAVEATVTLDACGLFCPEPVMLLHNRIRDMQGGEVLEMIATDPSTTRDVPRFCQFLGHELISQQEQGGRYLFHVRKARQV